MTDVWCFLGLARAAAIRAGVSPHASEFDDVVQDAALSAWVARGSRRPGSAMSESSWCWWAAKSTVDRKRAAWRRADSATVTNDWQAELAVLACGGGEWSDPTGDAATDRAQLDMELRRLRRERPGLAAELVGYAAGYTTYELAAMTGTRPSTVQARLRPFFRGERNETPRRSGPPRRPVGLRGDARRLRAEGLPYQRVADQLGVTASTVFAWCKEADR